MFERESQDGDGMRSEKVSISRQAQLPETRCDCKYENPGQTLVWPCNLSSYLGTSYNQSKSMFRFETVQQKYLECSYLKMCLNSELWIVKSDLESSFVFFGSCSN